MSIVCLRGDSIVVLVASCVSTMCSDVDNALRPAQALCQGQQVADAAYRDGLDHSGQSEAALEEAEVFCWHEQGRQHR